jgi:hypothetical protein
MNASATAAPSRPCGLPGLSAPSADPQSQAAGDPFHSVLDRAVGCPSGRGTKADAAGGNATENLPTRADETKDGGSRERRVRAKSKTDEPDADETLAGALAVTATPPPPDAPAPPTPLSSGDGEAAADGQAVVTADGAVPEAMAADATGEVAALPIPADANPGAISLENWFRPASTLTPVIAEPPAPLPPSLESPAATVATPDVANSAGAEPPQTLTPEATPLAAERPRPGDSPAVELASEAAVDAVTGKEVPAAAAVVAGEWRAVRRAWAETQEKARGISTAKMTAAMKNTQKKDEIAGVAEQILPGVKPEQMPPLPGLSAGLRAFAAGEGKEDPAVAPMGERMSPAPVRADGAAATDEIAAAPTPVLGRIGELVTREVRLFKRAADDLVEVVLTPDAKTQISLRLQWREGHVEVQARCDLGDYRSLNGQWPQLQSALAGQGVRLSHLSERVQTGLTDFFNQSNFSQSHGGDRRPPEPRLTPEAAAPLTAPRTASPAERRVVRSNRLLESWA